MSLRNESLPRTLKRRRKKPDRLFTPSISPSPALSESTTSSSSALPSREPSVVSSTTSTTSDYEGDEISSPPPQNGFADDTDALTEHGLLSIPDGIRDAKSQGQYFPPDHFLAPPTPEQLRRKRKRKPRKSLYTFVRQHQQKPPTKKKKVFLDPQFKDHLTVDRSKCLPMASVTIPFKPIPRDELLINSKEFIPVKVLERIYKPTVRRRRRRIYKEGDQGIGIGGYIIRFADGHEHCFPIDQLNAFLERYPGLEDLIEEYEHLTLAREDDDQEAVRYFKRQRKLREQNGALNNDSDTKGKQKAI